MMGLAGKCHCSIELERRERQQSVVKKMYAHCSLTSFGKCSSLGHLQADCLPLDILAALSFVFPIYLVTYTEALLSTGFHLQTY